MVLRTVEWMGQGTRDATQRRNARAGRTRNSTTTRVIWKPLATSADPASGSPGSCGPLRRRRPGSLSSIPRSEEQQQSFGGWPLSWRRSSSRFGAAAADSDSPLSRALQFNQFVQQQIPPVPVRPPLDSSSSGLLQQFQFQQRTPPVRGSQWRRNGQSSQEEGRKRLWNTGRGGR
jgi:hypothetical protein